MLECKRQGVDFGRDQSRERLKNETILVDVSQETK
jgi:hypothetical protein